MVKVTYTLDDETVARVRRAAERLRKPQSAIVREAIEEYSVRINRLSERERRRLLHAFDTLVPSIPARPPAEVAAEIRAIRAARKRGGRRRA